MCFFFLNRESYILNYLIMAYGHAHIFDKYFHLCLQQCFLDQVTVRDGCLGGRNLCPF